MIYTVDVTSGDWNAWHGVYCLEMSWGCGGLFVWRIVGDYEELSTANERGIMTCCVLRFFSVIWTGLDVC